MKERHRFDFPENVTLLGGYCTRMTNEERNAWHAYTETHPAFAELRAIESRILPAMHSGQDISAMVEERAEILRRWHQIAKAWDEKRLADLDAKSEAEESAVR